jgi:hypothetical protein
MSNVLALTSRFGYVHGESEFFSRLLARIAKYPYDRGSQARSLSEERPKRARF